MSERHPGRSRRSRNCWTGDTVRLDPIVIHPYDSAWAEAFERERRRIAPALSPWVVRGIEHIGSTAVPGRPAKAIIDMLAVVSDVHEVQGAIEATMDIGWFLAPEPGDELDRRISFCFPSIEKQLITCTLLSNAPMRGSAGWPFATT
jgi:GrpB-like predicted nucleotidyltransferase (UPF0157 family)